MSAEAYTTPLHTHPQRPLTDEQIDAVIREQWGSLLGSMMTAHRVFARAIERAHGIRSDT